MIFVSSPKKSEMQFCITTYKPIDAMRYANTGTFLWRIVRNTNTSHAIPIKVVVKIAKIKEIGNDIENLIEKRKKKYAPKEITAACAKLKYFVVK